MNRVSIIVHSVNGNCFIIGNHLKNILEKRKIEVRFYKVQDDDLHIAANESDAANEYFEDILALPIVKNEKLLKSKMIILGSPALFSNITTEMTEFLKQTKDIGPLKDKYFTCFTSSEKGFVDGQGCITTMEKWAQAKEMNIVSDLPNVIHVSGEEGMIRPSVEIANQLNQIADWIENNLLS